MRADKLQVDRMAGLGFTEAVERLRSLEEFVVCPENTPVSSRAVCRAVAIVDL